MTNKRNFKKIVLSVIMAVVLSFSCCIVASAQSTDYAKSKETLQIHYTGYIQFKPSYKIPANAGYSLSKGKYVKRAYVNYTRDGKCVTTTGARVYTKTAKSKKSNSMYSATAHAWDSLIWGDKYTTKFYYGWIYF